MTSRHPFTLSQWQELEHQALFFKFMVSGLPIPPDLIFNIKETTSQQSQQQSQSHHIGWTCFQLGLTQSSNNSGGIDQEPSRCRRTDGKKWRCSRYTTGDSKYCERHMHRGKSISIKKHPDNNNLKHLQNFPSNSLVQESASAGSGNQSNSNISSVTTHSSKDSIFLSIEELSSAGDDKREMKIVQYHQFIEEAPESGRDSWLKLVI